MTTRGHGPSGFRQQMPKSLGVREIRVVGANPGTAEDRDDPAHAVDVEDERISTSERVSGCAPRRFTFATSMRTEGESGP